MENKKGKLGSRLAGSEAFLSVAASLICIVIGLPSSTRNTPSATVCSSF